MARANELPCESWLRADCHDFLESNLANATRIHKRGRLLRFSINHAWTLKSKRFSNVQFLEFGVHEGKDICRIAAFVVEKESQTKSLSGKRTTVHGFDSFAGLPEDWENGQRRDDGTPLFQAGSFNVQGEVPEMSTLWENLNLSTKAGAYPGNVAFHKGWFRDTVPHFFESNQEPVAFVHADADLYSSTLTFLTEICERKLFRKGSVVTFDEFWNFENWMEGEYRAWTEIASKYQLKYRYLCYHAPSEGSKQLNWYGYQSVSIEILKNM